MKIPPQSTLSGFFDKKIQEFDEWIVEVFEPFFEFWPSVWHLHYCSEELDQLILHFQTVLVIPAHQKSFQVPQMLLL